jgi:nuclear GTP-binding protein
MGKRNKGANTKGQKRKDLAKKGRQAFSRPNFSGIDKKSKAPTNPNRPIEQGKESFYRTKAKIKLLNLYKSKPSEDRFKRPEKPARIEPNRMWFGNVRTIDPKKLEQMRKEMDKEKPHDTYNIFLTQSHLPRSLINPISNEGKIKNKLTSFEETFGKNCRRTKPNLQVYTMEELADTTNKMKEEYKIEKDSNLNYLNEEEKNAPEMKYMKAGQSKRIYSELLKVIDASDVLCEILDARDPLGTRCSYLENFVKKNCPHKHIIYILNKCDLVPIYVTAAYIKYLSKFYPTIAFHASITNPFGKPALFQILRQFDALHKDKKNISVGFVGYPNVGKSSVINSLKKQKCCKAAPIPGETKVWQYIALTKRIYLIDCPGVVYEEGQSEMDRVLKNVVRAEKIEEPMIFVQGILDRVHPEIMKKIYKINSWTDTEDFVKQCANKYGKLVKGGDPDYKATAKIILLDWQRGKIPYYVEPPKEDITDNGENKVENELKNVEGINPEMIDEGKDMNQKYKIVQDINELAKIKEMKEKEENKKNKDKMDEED